MRKSAAMSIIEMLRVSKFCIKSQEKVFDAEDIAEQTEEQVEVRGKPVQVDLGPQDMMPNHCRVRTSPR